MRDLILLILLCFGLSLSAQNETNHWYFGNKAAMDFNGGVRTILNDSQMNAPYGSATISDKAGNLLFYTNGQTIWNKKHQIMDGGDGLNGNPENAQSSIIIPKPNSASEFYVFTTNTEKGLQYSIVEFTPSKRLGEVTDKNRVLTSFSSECLTAIHHKNGENIWVISMKDEKKEDRNVFSFQVFEITRDGVNFNPVIIPDEMDIEFDEDEFFPKFLKISPDGKFLALTTGEPVLYIYNFNSSDGSVTNKIDAVLAINLTDGFIPHSVAFSQDSESMFIAANYYPSNKYVLLKADLTKAIDDINTPAFGMPIYTNNNFIPGSLQVALDGKIYAALETPNSDNAVELGVIDDPQNVIQNGIFSLGTLNLEDGRSTKGLPNFIQSYFAARILTDNQCFVNPFTFTAKSFTTISSIEWDFGDGNTDTELNVTHTYSAPGTYTVKAILTINGAKVTVFKSIEAYALPSLNPNQELVECDTDFDGETIFNLNSIQNKISNASASETFLFFNSKLDALDGDINKSIKDPDNYMSFGNNEEVWVRVENKNECFEITSFSLNISNAQLDTIPEFYTCEVSNGEGEFNLRDLESHIRNKLSLSSNISIELYANFDNAQRNRNKLRKKITTQSTTIFVKGIDSSGGCAGITSMQLFVNILPKIALEEEYTICFDPSLQPPVILSLNSNFDAIEWTDPSGMKSSQISLTISQVGNYTVNISKTQNGITCSNTKSFTVVNPPKPSFGVIDVNTENESNNMVQVEVIGNSSYSFSLDNINFFGSGSNHVFSQVTPGIRTIYVKDQNNCEEPISIKVSVIGFKSFFSPNGDGKNEFWNITGLDSNSFKSVNVLIYNRYGTIVGSITDFSTNGWDGTFNGKPQISSTYWYTAVLVDNDDEVIKKTGNFSLVRE